MNLCKKDRPIKPPWVEDEEDRVFTGYTDIVELVEDLGVDIKKVRANTLSKTRQILIKDSVRHQAPRPEYQRSDPESPDVKTTSTFLSYLAENFEVSREGVVPRTQLLSTRGERFFPSGEEKAKEPGPESL